MKVLLVNLPASGESEGFAGASRFPIGIALISAVLKKAKFDVKVLDLNQDYCLNKIGLQDVSRILNNETYDVLLVGGGIIPKKDIAKLKELGMGKLFGPGTPVQDTIDYITDWINRNRR